MVSHRQEHHSNSIIWQLLFVVMAGFDSRMAIPVQCFEIECPCRNFPFALFFSDSNPFASSIAVTNKSWSSALISRIRKIPSSLVDVRALFINIIKVQHQELQSNSFSLW
jgi:hypothetical protein